MKGKAEMTVVLRLLDTCLGDNKQRLQCVVPGIKAFDWPGYVLRLPGLIYSLCKTDKT